MPGGIILWSILLVAAALRLSNLRDQGFMVGDDAAYLNAAKDILENAGRQAEAYGTSWWTMVNAMTYYRPGFILLLLSSTLLFGVSPFAGALVSAVAGLLTVVMVYGMTKRLFGHRAALLATALFAISTWHIFHSRVGLSNATATMFWTLGLAMWLRFSEDRTRSRVAPFIAGLAFGYAFTCHYSLLLYLGLIGLCELWLAIQQRTYRGSFALVAGGVLPLVVLYALGGYPVWSEILRLSETVQAASGPLYYLRLFWRDEPLLLVFSLVGLIRVFQKAKQGRLDQESALYAVAVLGFIGLSVVAAGGNGRPRLMIPLLPLFAVLSGGAGTLLMNSTLFQRSRMGLWQAMIGAVLIVGLVSNRGFFSWHSGFAEAAAYLHAHYPTARYACNGSWQICAFYRLGPPVSHTDQLEEMTPPAGFLFAQERDQSWAQGAFGAFSGQRVAEFENRIEQDPLVQEEIGSGVLARGMIRIYDLRHAGPMPSGQELTALMTAAAQGDTARVAMLLDQGAELEAHDATGGTALIYAAMQGRTATVTVLLDRGAHLEGKNKTGQTALMIAAAQGHTAVVTTLLDRGAAVRARDRKGRTALMFAADRGHTAAVTALLDRGADVQQADDLGQTALMFAAARGHGAAVATLLDRGADVQARDKMGQTAFMLAIANRHTPVAHLLRMAGAKE